MYVKDIDKVKLVFMGVGNTRFICIYESDCVLCFASKFQCIRWLSLTGVSECVWWLGIGARFPWKAARQLHVVVPYWTIVMTSRPTEMADLVYLLVLIVGVQVIYRLFHYSWHASLQRVQYTSFMHFNLCMNFVHKWLNIYWHTSLFYPRVTLLYILCNFILIV